MSLGDGEVAVQFAQAGWGGDEFEECLPSGSVFVEGAR